MKHNYSVFIFVALMAFGLKANAQCSSCTTTISGMDAANHIVAPGTTLCISATGTATGLITVSPGGTLCNSGTINSSNLWVAGGTFNNYGTLLTTRVLASDAGTFNNYGSVLVDSLMISEANTHFYNHDTMGMVRFSVVGGAFADNYGSITVDYFGDSTGTFSNAGFMEVGFDFANAYNSDFSNNGTLIVHRDFSNSFSSGFINNTYMQIDRDFYNSTSATFQARCMSNVGRDWYNSAVISGPSSGGSCGGFAIVGLSLNSGTINAHLDFCDAGNPPLGIDGNSGTIAPGTTFCACPNACAIIVTGIQPIVQSEVKISNLYPNPAVNTLALEISTREAEALQVEVYDMTGRRQMTSAMKVTTGENKLTLDVSSLAQGAYILSITDEHQLQAKQLFNVTK